MAVAAKKNFVIITFAVGMSLGLLFASISFICWHRNSQKKSLFLLTAGQAKLIASNVKCSLAFSDIKDANEILGSLKTQNHVVFACIYDCRGKPFARYSRDDARQKDFEPAPPLKTRFSYRHGYLIVSEPVIDEHELLGTVCIWAKQ